MKNLFNASFLLFIFTLIFSPIYAQIDVNSYVYEPVVDTGVASISSGDHDYFEVEVKGLSKKEVQKMWGKYLKSFDTKSKWDKKAKEHFANDAKIKSISDNTIDVYSKIEEVGEVVKVKTWFNLGGSYLSTVEHPSKAIAGRDFMITFAQKAEKKRLENYKDGEEKKLKNLNKDLANLKKDKSKMESAIEEYKRKIKEAEENIKRNIENQENKDKEIVDQQQNLEKLNGIISKF